jgi:hypothetical protein
VFCADCVAGYVIGTNIQFTIYGSPGVEMSRDTVRCPTCREVCDPDEVAPRDDPGVCDFCERAVDCVASHRVACDFQPAACGFCESEVPLAFMEEHVAEDCARLPCFRCSERNDDGTYAFSAVRYTPDELAVHQDHHRTSPLGQYCVSRFLKRAETHRTERNLAILAQMATLARAAFDGTYQCDPDDPAMRRLLPDMHTMSNDQRS